MPVPCEMALADRWMRWKRVTRGDGTTKQPITTDGKPASSTDPSTWTALEQAENSTTGDGLGFALGNGFACIDLDHCYDNRGHLTDWAKMLIAPVAGRTYIEISPSGDGLHIWGTAPQQTGIRIRNTLGMNIEAYTQGRYMTYTGRTFRDSPTKLADLTFLLAVIPKLA
ncbi:bifunctional DNA primase/polymerase [Bifidobacterium imperatoris]|nr:bifunctional DNA primase/polymerase [Bifidobacterium imperatoris]QSY58717.1 bifunctional DNA primase/polymerase [Bifidobacterium imperatoris]